MVCENDPTIEQMRQDLLQGGWTSSCGGALWTNVMEHTFRGPHKAWHIWHGGISEWTRVIDAMGRL